MMLLIIICLIATTLQTQTSQTPLLKAIFTSASQSDFEQLSKTAKTASFGEFIQIQHQECSDNISCPHFSLFDPFGNLLQEYSGEASFDRYMEMIERFIDLNNYPLRKVEGQSKIQLADEKLSVRIFEERRRLVEMEKSEDWEKAASFKKKAAHRKPHEKPHEKMPTHSKPKKLSNLHEETPEEHQQTEAKTALIAEEPAKPVKNEKIATRFQQVEHVWRWRFCFIVMTIGLLIGMKYLKREQQRIGNNDDHQVKVQQQESDSLND